MSTMDSGWLWRVSIGSSIVTKVGDADSGEGHVYVKAGKLSSQLNFAGSLNCSKNKRFLKIISRNNFYEISKGIFILGM